ncbi:MAG TPA: signal peptidase II [Vicinamibacterales bacterium]|jgi:signal peptidase II|nr:signal peptidase II [Vicinamibacterales bacterium]
MAVTRFQVELSIAAAVVVLDQIVKAVVRSTLDLHESVVVIPSFFSLTRVHNYGAAFGLMNAAEFPFKTVVLSIVATLALGALSWYGATLPAEQRLARLGLALIIGGAAGNLIDRLRSGYVVDFVDLYWRDWHFWAFNVADAAITVGVSLMILDLLQIGRHRVSRAV